MGLGPWVCVKHGCGGRTGECEACKGYAAFATINAASMAQLMNDAVAKERARIVAWLRELGRRGRDTVRDLAGSIERGDHIDTRPVSDQCGRRGCSIPFAHDHRD
jgi:hypothetical protein